MPEGFYTTVKRGQRVAYLMGPFPSHQAALDCVNESRERAEAADPWTHFDAFGTCKVTAPMLPKAKFSK